MEFQLSICLKEPSSSAKRLLSWRHLIRDAIKWRLQLRNGQELRISALFLGPFAVITSLMSGSNYPTSNLYFYQVWLIHDWLRINEKSEDEVVREMVPPMKEKFDKYWEEVSCVFAMAVVFDPRFKLSIVDCCLGKLDMSTRDAKLRNLRDKLSTLFESYDKKSKTNSPSTEPRETVPQNVCAEGSMGMFENYNVSVSIFFNILFIYFFKNSF